VLVERPAPKSWAPNEVICHLRDNEEWFLERMRLIVAMDLPRFVATNPDRWADERQYLTNDAAVALAAFTRRRRETLHFLGALAPDAWARAGIHIDSRGRRTIDEFLSVMAWHDDNHLDQLRRALLGRP
jgi:DinB superfamily